MSHPAVHSAQRTASVMHYPGKEVAKTVAIRAGQRFLAVLPARDLSIVFCAGTLSEGVRMGNAEFIHLVKPKVGDFADKV